MSGPYDTAAQARADAAPLTEAIHAVDPGVGPMTDTVRAARLQARVDYLTRALTGAGVELGEYDTRIVAWLADWETETLQVLVGWIERARVGLVGAAASVDAPSVPADLAGFPWRVYGLPRPGDQGRPWLVNAFTTKQGAEGFAERHHEHGPLTVTYAAEDAAASEPEVTHHAVMRHGIAGPACVTGRFWESMTRDARAVTCPSCLAALPAGNGGA